LGLGFGFGFVSVSVSVSAEHNCQVPSSPQNLKKKIYFLKKPQVESFSAKPHKNKLNGLLKEMKLRKKNEALKKKILKKMKLFLKKIRKLFSTLNELKRSCGFRRILAFPTSRNGILRKEKNVAKIQWKPLNVITLGQCPTNSINLMMTISNVLHLE
jgi:hypothetical protein